MCWARSDARGTIDMDDAIRQLVSRAVYSTEVADIFAAAGLDKPDISILSDEFLAGELKVSGGAGLASIFGGCG